MDTRSTGLAAALAVCGALTTVSGIAQGTSQRPQATFRTAVDYVEVDVVVTDASGAFVHGLTAADFELVEDKQPQAIEAFYEINVPLERGERDLVSGKAIPSDIASNTATSEGRVYMLVLDDLHIDAKTSNRTQRLAREFVERYVGANDLVAVIHTSGRSDVSQDFTSNRALMLRAIDGFMGRALPSAVKNKIDEYNQAVQDGRSFRPDNIRDRDASERLAVARATFGTVSNLATYLASLSGRRKALLLFSEGTDMDSTSGAGLSGAFSEMQDARTAMLASIAAATRANVHVYAIDPATISSGIDADTGFIPSDPLASSLGLTSQALEAEHRNKLTTLRTVAEQTGGAALVNTSNFADGFARIVSENSTYYLLGYYPASKRDGKFHNISVRTKRSGLTVRARAGYHAPKAGKSGDKADADPLTALISAAVPSAGLPMRLAVPAFKHTSAEARVWMSIEVPPDVLRFEEQSGVASEDLILVYQVLDPGAKVVASSREEVQMRLRPQTRAAVAQHGFRVVIPVQVKPGRYQVRVAARTANGARQGSVFADLVVPDFFKGPLAWSGVALTSAASVAMPTRPSNPDLAKAFPLMPAAVRTFAAGDTLAFYAEAYDNGAGAEHAVDLTAVIRDDTGKQVFTTSETRSSAELGGGRGGYGFQAQIPLRDLPPGAYVLTLTATPRTSRDAAASQDIPFTVR